MRGIFQVGIDEGLIYRNPGAKLKKRRPKTKHLELPATAKFGEIVESVRKQGAWCSKQCGDLLEFLACSFKYSLKARSKHFTKSHAERNGFFNRTNSREVFAAVRQDKPRWHQTPQRRERWRRFGQVRVFLSPVPPGRRDRALEELLQTERLACLFVGLRLRSSGDFQRARI